MPPFGASVRRGSAPASPETQPFRLTRFADGGLELSDPSTGRVVNLGAFGPSNFAAFIRLLADTRLADSGAVR